MLLLRAHFADNRVHRSYADPNWESHTNLQRLQELKGILEKESVAKVRHIKMNTPFCLLNDIKKES